MKMIPVYEIKYGTPIVEEVLTQSGNVLFQKGKKLNEREIDILKAFQIKTVPVSSDGKKTKNDKSLEEQTQTESQKEMIVFQSEYHKMYILLKKAFMSVNSVQDIPIMDIRDRLHALIDNMSSYNILTFTPLKMKIEDNLYHNSIKVSLTAYSLAVWCGLPKRDLIPIAMAGLLYDIGKMKVDETILDKASTLTTDEFKQAKQHVLQGYNILKNIAGLNEGIKLAALQHHEKEDGSGYPFAVKSEKIHIYAKIVSIADIFHAMTSKRYHKEASSPYIVLEQLFNESFGKLNPKLVQTFIQKVTQFNQGTIVRLNDDSVGEIVFTDRSYPTRPWVNVQGKIINLSTIRSMYIKEVIEEF